MCHIEEATYRCGCPKPSTRTTILCSQVGTSRNATSCGYLETHPYNLGYDCSIACCDRALLPLRHVIERQRAGVEDQRRLFLGMGKSDDLNGTMKKLQDDLRDFEEDLKVWQERHHHCELQRQGLGRAPVPVPGKKCLYGCGPRGCNCP